MKEESLIFSKESFILRKRAHFERRKTGTHREEGGRKSDPKEKDRNIAITPNFY